jgi:hypothetical protein
VEQVKHESNPWLVRPPTDMLGMTMRMSMNMNMSTATITTMRTATRTPTAMHPAAMPAKCALTKALRRPMHPA